jgi:MOSC domain-containing protein YiiM
MFRGHVVGIYTAPTQGAPMERRNEVRAVAGVGLDGDRYASRDGKYTRSADNGKRAITLIEREAVDAARRQYDLELEEHEARRNVVTEGVPLNHLVGRTFRVGDVVLRGFKLSEPCTYLEGLTRAGIRRALVHRAGLRAEILEGGTIHVGDVIEEHADAS